MNKTNNFIITTLCRADFSDYLKLDEFEKIPDNQMYEFAGRIQNALMENGIWSDLIEKFAYEVKNRL